MRLLLGENNSPSLLVEVKRNVGSILFHVLNGNWDGKIFNDNLFCKRNGEYVNCGKIQVLCRDQDLLKGEDYNEIIERWEKK